MTCEASCSQCLNNEEVLGKVKEYINQTKWIVLSTVTQDKVPVSRTMASVVNDGLNLYFSTGKIPPKLARLPATPMSLCCFSTRSRNYPTLKMSLIPVELKELNLKRISPGLLSY